MLRPRQRFVVAPPAQTLVEAAAAQPPVDRSAAFGGCRWVGPLDWSCK